MTEAAADLCARARTSRTAGVLFHFWLLYLALLFVAVAADAAIQ